MNAWKEVWFLFFLVGLFLPNQRTCYSLVLGGFIKLAFTVFRRKDFTSFNFTVIGIAMLNLPVFLFSKLTLFQLYPTASLLLLSKDKAYFKLAAVLILSGYSLTWDILGPFGYLLAFSPFLYHRKKPQPDFVGNDLVNFLGALGACQTVLGVIQYHSFPEIHITLADVIYSLFWDITLTISQTTDLFTSLLEVSSRKLILLSLLWPTESYTFPVLMTAAFIFLSPQKIRLDSQVIAVISLTLNIALSFHLQWSYSPPVTESWKYTAPELNLTRNHSLGTDSVSVMERPVYVYFAGNLRNYGEECSSLAALIFQMKHPNLRVYMHTWSTFDHTSITYYRGRIHEDDHTKEIRQLLQSDKNMVAKVATSFDFTIESLSQVQIDGKLRVPNERLEMLSSIFYTWRAAHSFAVTKSEEFGGMADTDVIIRLRPDIHFVNSFDPVPIAAYLKKFPNTLLAYYPVDTDEYRNKGLLSDCFWITTKLVMDKFSKYDPFDFLITESAGRDAHQTEHYFFRILQHIQVNIEWLPTGFRINYRDKWPVGDPSPLSYPTFMPETSHKDILPPQLLRKILL
jgi:hypothetical protein